MWFLQFSCLLYKNTSQSAGDAAYDVQTYGELKNRQMACRCVGPAGSQHSERKTDGAGGKPVRWQPYALGCVWLLTVQSPIWIKLGMVLCPLLEIFSSDDTELKCMHNCKQKKILFCIWLCIHALGIRTLLREFLQNSSKNAENAEVS